MNRTIRGCLHHDHIMPTVIPIIIAMCVGMFWVGMLLWLLLSALRFSSTVRGSLLWGVAGHVDRHPHSVLYLFDDGLGQTNFGHLLEDALDSGAPLLHNPGFTEDARKGGIAQAGHAQHGVDGHTWQQQSRAVHLNAVVVEADSDGSAAFRVGGVHEGVDDHFADRLDGDRVDVAAPHLAEHRGLVGVLEQELYGTVDC